MLPGDGDVCATLFFFNLVGSHGQLMNLSLSKTSGRKISGFKTFFKKAVEEWLQ